MFIYVITGHELSTTGKLTKCKWTL